MVSAHALVDGMAPLYDAVHSLANRSVRKSSDQPRGWHQHADLIQRGLRPLHTAWRGGLSSVLLFRVRLQTTVLPPRFCLVVRKHGYDTMTLKPDNSTGKPARRLSIVSLVVRRCGALLHSPRKRSFRERIPPAFRNRRFLSKRIYDSHTPKGAGILL